MRTLLLALCALSLASAGFADNGSNTKASMLLGAESARPGDTVLVGVRFEMEDEWHIYWRNPGGPGIPTTLDWTLPSGVTAGDIQWPLPEKFVQSVEGDPDPTINYGYGHEVILLVPLKLGPELKPGEIQIKARASWLACKTLCIPGDQELSATLKISGENVPSPHLEKLRGIQASLPKSGESLSARAFWEKPASADSRPLIIEWKSTTALIGPDFFADIADGYEVKTGVEVVSNVPGTVRLRKFVTRSEGNWPVKISGLIVQEAGGKRDGFDVKLPITDDAAKTAAVATAAGGDHSLLFYLLYSFLGGLILNIMPCVLPVIALKILGFVQQAKDSPGQIRKLGLIYAAGVLVSFLGLAALVLGIKAVGLKASWGMQFSNPMVVIGFATLVTLVALNLFGVFEIFLGGNVMNTAGELASRHGAGGAFFNGVLATVLATPCTAPFLSIALGFAFTQSAAIIVLMFLTVGAGLAFPYVLLSWYPAWLKFLPKPGAWMEKFKMAMGFPMLVTAVWLAKIGPEKYGERAWWLGVFLVLVAAAAWVFGEFVQRGRRRKGLGWVFVIGLLALAYLWALESKLGWRSPVQVSADAPLKNAPKGYAWKKWSPSAVEEARKAGRIVVVDFTAWWCATCNTHVKPAFGSERVIIRLKELEAVALLADHSDFPPEITAELENFQRAGVPLVLVYPRDTTLPPIVLPDPNPLLGYSHFAGLIDEALLAAAGRKN